MKVYSNTSITKEEVEAIALAALEAANANSTAFGEAVDQRQSLKIKRLETLLIASFVVNLIIAIGAYFF